MSRPRLLVLGSSGQVGWELMRTLASLGDVAGVDYPEVDFAQPDSLRQSLKRFKPEIILNAAAYTAVDKAETEPDLCRAVNATAPGILAEEAAKLGALLVHYSTDYVFDGTRRQPYLETDSPNPLGVYGETKLAGDEAVRRSGCDHLIFRLCWVYGARARNFMVTMLKLAREQETLRVVVDQVGCPTWCRLIAEATSHAVGQTVRSLDRNRLVGTYHLASSGQTSWHGFTQAIIATMPVVDRRCTLVEPIPTSEFPTPAKRPPYSVLNCGKLEKAFGLRLPDWQTSLNQVLQQ